MEIKLEVLCQIAPAVIEVHCRGHLEPGAGGAAGARLPVLGRGLENRNLFGGVLLPIVILAMLIDRFSIVAAEEGLPRACVLLGWTGAVALCIYPVFRSEQAGAVLFGYPELVISIMGLLVLVGGYTGYRLLEIVRFRAFARAHAANVP